MNKSELIESILLKVPSLTKKQAGEALDATLNTVTECLQNKETVTLVGFGTFSVKERAARKGVNPKTGQSINIKASNAPSFKAGKTLKDACNLELETVD